MLDFRLFSAEKKQIDLIAHVIVQSRSSFWLYACLGVECSSFM